VREAGRASVRARLLLHVVQGPLLAIVRSTVDPAALLFGSLDEKAQENCGYCILTMSKRSETGEFQELDRTRSPEIFVQIGL